VFLCFSTLLHVFLNKSYAWPAFACSRGWVSQLVIPCPQFLSLTQTALGKHPASLVGSRRALGFCVTCRGTTISANPVGMSGCLNLDPEKSMGSLTQSCGLPQPGCAPRASKPIPWEFFRAQPTQTHASACGIWRMAWFPLMLTYFLAFLSLHRRRISRRRILQSPKAPSLRSPEDDRAHPPLLLILRPLLPRPVSAAIP
jgi:hypothetical protein